MKHFNARQRYIATDQLRARMREQGRMASWMASQIGVSAGHFGHVLAGRRDVAEVDARVLAAILGSDFFSLWKVAESTEEVEVSIVA